MIDPSSRRAQRLFSALEPQRGRGGLVTYNPVAQANAVRSQLAQEDADAALSPAEQAIKAAVAARPSSQGTPSGWKGALGSILGSPVGAALGAIDIPRRVVWSTIKELSDLQGLGDSDASFSDFFNQIGDPTFGAGDVIPDTGNKWADRAIGFTGDVLGDPTTYLTFGTGKFAGLPGRIRAASKLSAAGMDDAAARVARVGVNAAKGKEREIIFAGLNNADELAKPGIRFMGKRIKGTEGFAQRVGENLSRTRAMIGDHLPRPLREIRYENGLEDAFRTLRSGKGNTKGALTQIGYKSHRTAYKNAMGAHFQTKLDQTVNRINGESDGKAIFQALDEGADLSQIPMAPETRQLLDEVFEMTKDAVPELKHREGFAPHIWEPDARKAMSGDEWTEVRTRIGMDSTAAQGGVISRTIQDGTTITLPDGQVIEFVADTPTGAVSAAQVNRKLSEPLGVDRVIVDDITEALEPYIHGMSESFGRGMGLRHVDEFAGAGDSGLVEQVDQAASKQVSTQRADEVAKTVAASEAGTARVAGELDRGAVRVQDDLLGELERQVEVLKRAREAAKDDVARTERQAHKTIPKAQAQVVPDAERATQQVYDALDALGVEQRELFEGAERELADAAAAKRQAQLDRDRISAKARRDQAKGVPTVKPAGPIPEVQAARETQEQVARRVAKKQTELDARRDALIGSLPEIEKKAAKDAADLDHARQAVFARNVDAKRRLSEARNELKRVRELIAELKKVNPTPKRGGVDAYQRVMDELDEFRRLVGDYEGSDTAAMLMSWYARGVSEMGDDAATRAALEGFEAAARRGEVVEVVKVVVKDGMERIGMDIMGDAGPIVTNDVARALQNFEKTISDPGFWSAFDTFTRFFKTYATATPGFHVRNGLSATFMNAADGVSPRNMKRGATLWNLFEKDPANFLNNLPDWVTEQQAMDVVMAVFGSGGGRGQFGAAELGRGSNFLTRNKFTEFSARIGGSVEGYVRAAMALDSVLAGEAWEEAAARITRIHFDYSAVSKFDERMKRLIPFWTFMSRNVPLQLQQMYLKPRAYQVYKSFQRNMGQDYENNMVPLSWQESGAFQVTDGVWLSPDLAHTRLEDDVTKLFSDPQRLMADFNPAIKVPLETLVGKRKFFSDQPFKENGFDELDGGLQILEPALKALGLTETAGDGSTVVDERLTYALRGLIPPLAQMERLSGANEYYADKQLQSVLNYLGGPIKLMTSGQVDREANRRDRVLESPADERRRQALLDYVSN